MATHTFTDDGKVALDVNVVGGGASGPSEVEVTNFPSSQAVTGPLTQAQLTTITGGVAASVYNDPTGAASGSMIQLLKGIYVQLAIIAENTTPTP